MRATILISSLLVACGDATPGGLSPIDDTTEQEPLVAPTVRLVSPPTLSAGDVVTVIGEDFVRPERGYVELNLRGTFHKNSGGQSSVDMMVRAEFINAGKVQFTFEPGPTPAAFGNVLGTFEGRVTATNADDEGERETSAPKDVDLEVGPSILLGKLAPSGMNCGGQRTQKTQSGKSIVAEVSAIGLASPTVYAPITFRASWVDLAGEAQVLEDEIPNGTPETTFTIDVGDVPHGQVRGTTLVTFSASDESGGFVTRSFEIDVAREYSVEYDGNVEVVELYAPVQVSSCLPGGTNGRDVSYSGGHDESRSRSVSYSVNVGIDIWVVNLGFGLGVSDTVSTSDSESLSLSGRVWPLEYGVFYRQTQRLLRMGQIIRRSVCGEDLVVGQARVTDWNWAPDLAITTNGQCPPAPPSNLPPAQLLD